MLNTDIFDRASWRVTEVDSKDEKSGAEVGNCVKGSRIRKPVPPPEEEMLLEPFRGQLRNV